MRILFMGFLDSDTILCGMRTIIPNTEMQRANINAQSGRLNPDSPPAMTRKGGPSSAAIQTARRHFFGVVGSSVFSRIKKVIRTGTIVMASKEDDAMANVFV